MSETFRHYLAGLIATAQEFSLLWAPTVNSYKRFQPGSWAPDRDRLGRRQPHTRLPQGRPRQGLPASSAASPAATPTATSPSPGRSPVGCTASATSCRSGSRSCGNGYEATEIGRIPWNLPDAIALVGGLVIARECFGDDVHHHILTMAKGEWQAFNQTVTDWELRRYWERM